MDLHQVAEKSWRNRIAMRRKSRAPAATHKFGPGVSCPSILAPLRAGPSAAPGNQALGSGKWNENGCWALHVRRRRGMSKLHAGWNIDILCGMTPMCLRLQYGRHVRAVLAADRGT